MVYLCFNFSSWAATCVNKLIIIIITTNALITVLSVSKGDRYIL